MLGKTSLYAMLLILFWGGNYLLITGTMKKDKENIICGIGVIVVTIILIITFLINKQKGENMEGTIRSLKEIRTILKKENIKNKYIEDGILVKEEETNKFRERTKLRAMYNELHRRRKSF